jgi:hypothetical protein
VPLSRRFRVYLDPYDDSRFIIQDSQWDARIRLPRELAENPAFDVADWYEGQLMGLLGSFLCPDPPPRHSGRKPDDGSGGGSSAATGKTRAEALCKCDSFVHKGPICVPSERETNLELHGVQVPRGTYPAIQRNAAVTKDLTRTVPRPIVVTVRIDGHPARALLDSGSLGDFLSSTLADQLKVKRVKLNVPLGLQLAVQGSRSKINSGAKVKFQYQNISEDRYLDIINISSYDVILGTPWMFQHQVCVGLNPSHVVIGSDAALPIIGLVATIYIM